MTSDGGLPWQQAGVLADASIRRRCSHGPAVTPRDLLLW
jgi:hypothetical protein